MDEITPPPPVPPTPPQTEPKPAESAAVEPVATDNGVAPNVAATICAALPLVGGVIFLVLEKNNAFVRFWAMQSVFFGGFAVVVSVLLQIATLILVHIPILGWLMALLLWLAGLVFGLGVLIAWVISIIKAYSNVEWEIPYVGKLARKQLSGQKLI